MSHTRYCVDLVAQALNLPPPAMVKTLANTNVQLMKIPAGGVLSILASVPSVLLLTFDDNTTISLPVPPGPLHVAMPDVGLKSVTCTSPATVAVWDGAAQLQTNESFTPE